MDMGFSPSSLKISVICFEDEQHVTKFEKKLIFAEELVLNKSISNESTQDGEVEFKLPKRVAPSYWPEILKQPTERDIVWKYINDYYFEENMDMKEKQAK